MSKNIIRLVLGLFIISFLALSLPMVQAQENVDQEPAENFSQEQLAQMLAPIALYPDTVLTQVLMASTYPIEVIEADRWVRKNPDLKGESLDNALLDMNWDPSVKALCHFPSILALMSEHISETTNIGNAFLAQEDEVMDMIQKLRSKAKAEGNLNSSEKQKIVIEKETIIIEPADPKVIYVPYYDPRYVYGPWWYPAYPPYYWGPSRISIGIGISYWPAFYFGFAFGGWSYFDWHRHYVYIEVSKRPRFVKYDRWRTGPGRWHHLPSHRKGVAYRDKFTAQKYGQYRYRPREYRPETRGFPERRDVNRYQRPDSRSRFDQGPTGIISRQTERTTRQRPTSTSTQPAPQNNVTNQKNRVITPPVRVEQQEIGRGRIKQRTLRTTQEPSGIEREVQTQRQPVVTSPQVRTRTEPQNQSYNRPERQQQMRSSDNIFNRVEEGSRESRSSLRGRYSRQGRENFERNWNRSDNRGYYDRSGSGSGRRGDRDRNRR
ncbi:MAG: DUF3300 domain-containing protein [Desulfobulbales bacterium]